MSNSGESASYLEAAADPGIAGLSVNRVKTLREWIEGKAPDRAYGCIILRNGRIGSEFYGGGFTPDSLFEIGSIRKSFNSALIGSGIKEGKISLDLIAADVWPELLDISGDPADAHITLHQLVSGVSGWLTPESSGSSFKYNNAGFTVAEKVVARIYGFANDEIAPQVEKRFKGILNARSWHVYHFTKKFDRLDIDNPGPKLAIDSTLRDLIKWGYLWLNNGVWEGQELIPPDYVALATRRVNPQIPNSRYGYNWFVNVGKMLWPRAPADSYGHAGFGTFKSSKTDSRAFLWICPSLDMAAAIVADFKKAMDVAAELSVDRISTCPLNEGHDYVFEMDYIKAYAYAEETFGAICAHNPAIRVCIEYKWNDPRTRCFFASAGETLSFCQAVGNPNLGVTLDFGHSLQTGERPAQAAAMLARYGRLFYVHLNDNDRNFDWDLMPGAFHFWEFIEFFYYLRQLGYTDDWYAYDVMSKEMDTVETFITVAEVTRKMEFLADKIDRDQMDGMLTERDPSQTMRYLYQSLL